MYPTKNWQTREVSGSFQNGKIAHIGPMENGKMSKIPEQVKCR